MSLPPPSAREARLIWLALSGLAIAVLVALVAGLVLGLSFVVRILSPVLWPLAVAGVLAYLLDPVVDFFERKGLKRPRAILAVFGLAFVIIATMFGSVAPQLVRETGELASHVPDYASGIQKRMEIWVENPPSWARRFWPG